MRIRPPRITHTGAELRASSGKGYYSVQVGSWRVIALNSMIEAGVEAGALAPHRAEDTSRALHPGLLASPAYEFGLDGQ
jgi:hypothetical protein